MNSVVYYSLQGALLIACAVFCMALVRQIYKNNFLERMKSALEDASFENQQKRLMSTQKANFKKMKKETIGQKIEGLLERSGLKKSAPLIDSKAIIIISVVSAIACYVVFRNSFGIISVGILAGIPGLVLPVMVLSLMSEKANEQVEKTFGDYLLQLKTGTRIHNDIIEAFRSSLDRCTEPLKTMTGQFLAEVNSGNSVESALSNFKQKVPMRIFRLFLTNVQYCYIYGGNFNELLDRTYKLFSEMQKEKRLRIKETRSARIVILLLIGMDVYLYFKFIMSQPEYVEIMSHTFMGQMILNINFLSIWFLLWLIHTVKKLDY